MVDHPYASITQFLLAAAAFVVVVLGMQMAESILVPFLLALFLAVITASPFFWLKRVGVPAPLAMLAVIVVMVGFVLGIVVLVSTSLSGFLQALPRYQALLADLTRDAVQFLERFGVDISFQVFSEYFDPGVVMQLAANTFTALSNVLTNVLLIVVMVIIMLVESMSFPDKLRAALKNPEPTLKFFDRFNDTIEQYVLIKTVLNLVSGALIALWLTFLGVDFPMLWGLLVFLLNFIPNFGAFIAAVPAILLSLVELGWGNALLTLGGYAVVNLTMGNLIEPRFMGRGMGLSVLVVFLSLVFWGWVLGPVGMVLSVPLTMTVKIGLEAHPQTRWLAILLDGRAPAPASPG